MEGQKIKRTTFHYSKKSNMFMEFYFANTFGVNFCNLGTGLGWIQSWNLGGHYPELDLEGP